MIDQADQSSYAIVHVCLVIIVAGVLGAFFLFILLFYKRFHRQYKTRKTAALVEPYSHLLTGIIFEEDDVDFEDKRKELIKHFKKTYLRSKFNRKILRMELIKLHKSFSGSSQTILRQLYLELNLHKEALRDLNETDWSVRASAVRELSQMHYVDAKPKIAKLTSHENPVLRLEAQAAILALEKENPFDFLATTHTEITQWQQLNLEEIARRMDVMQIPVFAKWFHIKNQSVIQFCIKMTALFNQFESGNDLIELLHSSDSKITREAIKALGTLCIDEAKTPLINLYRSVPAELQNEIIISIGKIGGEDVVPFLVDILYNAPYEQAMKAGKALRDVGYEGILILQQALNNGNTLTAAIAEHMLDDRI